ncbi:shikimate dehydrogenase [Candidatus Nitronereus thalassa]|uniref:Shikimate dehydrogenase (NADP(+)) n=1 Tax=Candidatus Nitronereus thalassa TaxID=3020898 RepID=A0ABU3KA24_9BACT|nr:shikimate dehydrogenase [Candidatus Nitronereus thalassa]MDT7043304.1 shikimate dehydrogenase [Candidatus Nitronereus thalassa]
MTINTQTQLCGVLGNPVEHSLSPAIHNAAFQHLGLNYVYLAFPVKPEQVKEAIQGIRALGNLRGFSVTIPHKVSAMSVLDEIDDTAKHIGAINTIVKTDQTLTGYNTDASGALQALRQAHVTLAGKHVLIIGTGGAARAIAFGLALHEPITSMTLLGILDEERTALAADLRKGSSVPITDAPINQETLVSAIEQSQVLIHCTPLGMHPKVDGTCIQKVLLKPHLTVMDIVYNPRETRLLREAREIGCSTIPGLEMFLHQAVAQFELWTKQSAPINVMRKILEAQFS